ncbi:MAG TPA: L-threonylcarbamoyladenylate synthase [Ktedonobacterales bacterium]
MPDSDPDQPHVAPTSRQTLVLHVTPEGEPRESIARAAEIVRAGGLVAFPTETVYGLGADATNPAAVAGIFAAKGRPSWDPLIVHIPGAAALPSVVAEAPPIANVLADRFWPGPLTLVLPRGPAIPASVAAGGPTVGVRVPASEVAQALLRAAGVPVAAPSANRFMHTSPTRAEHVIADLDGRIDCLLDGGPCSVGVESTVLDLATSPPRILRPGGVTLEALREVLGTVEGPPSDLQPPQGIAAAPGQMERHYAPRAHLVVFDAQGQAALEAISGQARDALARGQRVGALLPDEEAQPLADLGVTIARLGPASDLAGISRQLYAALRSLDKSGVDLILAHTFGTEGLGLALRDRLRRAAGGTFRSV